MLEIVLIFFLCRWCYRKAKAKGHSGGWFAFMGAALWLGFETVGIVIGVLLMIRSNTDIYTAYFFGLVGAAVGASITLFIVRRLRARPVAAKPERSADAAGPIPAARTQRYCRRCGSPIPEGGAYCAKCGEPAEKN